MFGSQISLSGICAVAGLLCTSLPACGGALQQKKAEAGKEYTFLTLRDLRTSFAHPLRSRGVLATKKAEAKASVFAYKEVLLKASFQRTSLYAKTG